MPILQLTYLKVINEAIYEFAVETIYDLLNLNADIAGLNETRELYSHGEIPVFTQIADISGVYSGGFAVIRPVENFVGTYNGNGYLLKNLMIVGQKYNYDTLSYEDMTSVGLFGSFTGVADNITMVNCTVSAKNAQHIGGIAGLMKEGSSITDSTFEGTVKSKGILAGLTVYAGGIAGFAEGGIISNCYSAGYLKVDASSVTAGGIAGAYDIPDGSAEINEVTDVHTFIETKSKAHR
jgi:hypothetical protein